MRTCRTQSLILYIWITSTLVKEYKTVVKLLDMNALTDMSVLIVNTCYLDPTTDNVDFLANFFYNDTFFEMSVIKGDEAESEDGDTWFNRVEGCDFCDLSYDGIRNKVIENFEFAYSAFQTAFLLDYSNRHKPSFEVFKHKMLSERLVQASCFSDWSINKVLPYRKDIIVEENFSNKE